MSVFSSLLTGPPADAVVEIAGDAVSAAALAARGGESVVQGCAVEPLPAGAVVPSLTGANVANRPVLIERLRAAIDRLPNRPRRVALLLPDVVGRVSLIRFDRLPARQDDVAQLVRWQMKKAAPFPIEEATLSYVPVASTPDGGRELLVALVRQDILRVYEGACEAIGLHPGLVDLATLGVVNLCLAAPAAGDRLLVHVRPEYTSLVILRGDTVGFFRTVPAGEMGDLADLVHQTTMYYQDRLGGRGFTQVILAGIGGPGEPLEGARRDLEGRLRVAVQPVETMSSVSFADRIGTAPEMAARLPPLLGTWLRMRAEVGA
jgi:Tfp pilus assembly PilM family ATPase